MTRPHLALATLTSMLLAACGPTQDKSDPDDAPQSSETDTDSSGETDAEDTDTEDTDAEDTDAEHTDAVKSADDTGLADTDVLDTDTNAADTDTDVPFDTALNLDLDGDGVTGLTDCDDTNADIYPGAPEACGDGIDSDCVPGASGTIVFDPADTSLPMVDLTPQALTGTAAAPANLQLYGAGTVYLCDGTWNLTVGIFGDDITLQGESQTGTVIAVDDVGSSGTLVTTNDFLGQSVQDLTLRELSASSNSFAKLTEADGDTVFRRMTVEPNGSRCISQVTGSSLEVTDSALVACPVGVSALGSGSTAPTTFRATNTTLLDVGSRLFELPDADVTLTHVDASGATAGVQFTSSTLGDLTLDHTTLTLFDQNMPAIAGDVVIADSTLDGVNVLTLGGPTSSITQTTFQNMPGGNRALSLQAGHTSTMQDVTIVKGTGTGGGLWTGGDLAATNLVLDGGNHAVLVVFNGGSATLTGGEVRNVTANACSTCGGAVEIEGSFSADGTAFTNNSGGNGGAVSLKLGAGAIHFANLTMDGNTAAYGGGAVGSFLNAPRDVTMTNVMLSNNTDTSSNRGGGALFTRGNVTLTDVIFEDNTTTAYGGALYAEDGTVTMTGGEVLRNSSTPLGVIQGAGGICHPQPVTLTNVVFGSGADTNLPFDLSDCTGAGHDTTTSGPATLTCDGNGCAP